MSKSLHIDKPVDSNLKPVKDSDGTNSALEVSTDTVRVKNLVVAGTTTGVSASDDTKLPLAGGTMAGNVDFGDNDITNVDGLDADRISIDGGTAMTGILDEDNMASDSAVKLATQQSIKAYVDSGAGVTASTVSAHTQIVYKASVSISEAEFNALHTTPKQIVAPPGADKVIVPLNAIIFVNRDSSTVNTSSANLVYFWAGGGTGASQYLAQIRRFMFYESGDRVYTFGGAVPQEAYQDDNITNCGIVLQLSSAITSGSIDGATFYMNYTIADFS